MSLFTKLKCRVGLHDLENTKYLDCKEHMHTEFPYIVGKYLFSCKNCEKSFRKEFAFPYGSGTVWSRKDAKVKAKNFKDIR